MLPKPHLSDDPVAALQAFRLIGALIVLCLLLQGCATGGGAPVHQIGERGKFHVVQKGETLYAIAWRYGLDYQQVAKRNGILRPYTIYVGQKLMIQGIAIPQVESVAKAKPSSRQTTRATRNQPAVVSQTKVQPPGFTWSWPIRGDILAEFNLAGNPNKGIDIAGKNGDPVKAAAGGSVVYAGGNLRGYGKLVIIKHNDDYLSAYGNNRVIKVKEGDEVQQGQVISEVGSDAGNVSMLHFEIRRDGKPINPMLYLPK